jgi:dsRNA-specific ribonuclease
MANSFEKLEKAVGYKFRNRELLRQALTPPSAGLPEDNQRMEFLGDSVLHICASRLVYSAHGDWREGDMSKLRSKIVSTDSLHDWAKDIGLVLERGPRSSKKRKTSTRNELADAIEALLAAVVLDAEGCGEDGFSQAFRIVEERFSETILTASLDDWEQDDPKTALQERVTAMGLGVPVYELLKKLGPEHAPVFLCKAIVGEYETRAKGYSLKRAQMEAARKLLGVIATARD